MVVTTTTMTTAISEAINPYSIAATPRESFRKRENDPRIDLPVRRKKSDIISKPSNYGSDLHIGRCIACAAH